MAQTSRNYRKNLASSGFIFMDGVEREIIIRNLSITGLLAELEPMGQISEIEDVFNAIKSSVTVDIYLPDMRLAGEASIVRADKVDGLIYMGMEFKNISYDVNNLLYKRRSYRKSMTAPGQITLNGTSYEFNTRNVSVDGLMIRIDDAVVVHENVVAKFDFPRLGLEGEIKVIWFEYDDDGGTILGLQYIHMEKTDIKGIPVFSQ